MWFFPINTRLWGTPGDGGVCHRLEESTQSPISDPGGILFAVFKKDICCPWCLSWALLWGPPLPDPPLPCLSQCLGTSMWIMDWSFVFYKHGASASSSSHLCCSPSIPNLKWRHYSHSWESWFGKLTVMVGFLRGEVGMGGIRVEALPHVSDL